MKTCTKCGQEKNENEFYYRNRLRGWRNAWCKSCMSNYKTDWRAVNPEKAYAYTKKWIDENRDQWNAIRRSNKNINARYRAKKRDAFIEVIDTKVVWNTSQGICGICFKPVDPQDWHLDHVIPISKDGPHSYENVQVAHPICNIKKGNRLNV